MRLALESILNCVPDRPSFPAPGAPNFGECDPGADADQKGPCCRPDSGYCGNVRGVDWGHCDCADCVDYSLPPNKVRSLDLCLGVGQLGGLTLWPCTFECTACTGCTETETCVRGCRCCRGHGLRPGLFLERCATQRLGAAAGVRPAVQRHRLHHPQRHAARVSHQRPIARDNLHGAQPCGGHQGSPGMQAGRARRRPVVSYPTPVSTPRVLYACRVRPQARVWPRVPAPPHCQLQVLKLG